MANDQKDRDDDDNGEEEGASAYWVETNVELEEVIGEERWVDLGEDVIIGEREDDRIDDDEGGGGEDDGAGGD